MAVSMGNVLHSIGPLSIWSPVGSGGLSAKQRGQTGELEAGKAFSSQKHSSSDILPPARLHHLDLLCVCKCVYVHTCVCM